MAGLWGPPPLRKSTGTQDRMVGAKISGLFTLFTLAASCFENVLPPSSLTFASLVMAAHSGRLDPDDANQPLQEHSPRHASRLERRVSFPTDVDRRDLGRWS